MGMRITTNISSINAQRSLTNSQREIQKSSAQLASGSRITKAADDAAGLSISESLRAQIRSYGQASRNANDGISMVQTAEGGLNEISNIMIRLRELAIQSSSDTVGETERSFIDKEVQQQKQEIERIAQTTRFGTTNLINGSADRFDFQVGINNHENEDRIMFDPGTANATLANLNLEDLDFSTKEGAQGSLEGIDKAQTTVNGFRSYMGALQNRLQSTIDNLGVANENISAANSRIRDADIAASSSDTVRNTILLNAATSVLAQANQTPQLALKMIG